MTSAEYVLSIISRHPEVTMSGRNRERLLIAYKLDKRHLGMSMARRLLQEHLEGLASPQTSSPDWDYSILS